VASFQRLLDQHLQETEGQVARLEECLSLLGGNRRAKPCKGMMGLVEEGEEVMEEMAEKGDAIADSCADWCGRNVSSTMKSRATRLRVILPSSCGIPRSSSISTSLWLKRKTPINCSTKWLVR